MQLDKVGTKEVIIEPSKQQLLQQALTHAFTEARSVLFKAGESGGIEGVIRQYLGQSHRDKAEKGYAFAALTAVTGWCSCSRFLNFLNSCNS